VHQPLKLFSKIQHGRETADVPEQHVFWNGGYEIIL